MDDEIIEKAIIFKKHIGNVIRKHRKRRGKYQYEFANDLEINVSSLNRFEKGNGQIRASTMSIISQICGFDLIEYVLMDGESLSDKFRYLVDFGRKYALSKTESVGLVNEMDIPARRVFYDVQVIGYDGNRAIFSGLVSGEKKRQKPKEEDILTIAPKNYPFPLCDDDNRDFEKYLYHPHMNDKRRMLVYGYELLKLYDKTDTSWKTSEALAKQILRKMITAQSGKPDPEVYDYYWKCVYSNIKQ